MNEIKIGYILNTKNPSVILTESNKHRAIIEAKEKGIKSIYIGKDSDSETIQDLEFLKEYDFIEKIFIQSNLKYDISPTEYLKDLKFLSLDCGVKKECDLSHLNNLNYFSGHYSKHIKSILDNKNISRLVFFYFSEGDMLSLTNMLMLSSLTLVKSSIKAMKGVERLSKLSDLRIQFNYKLDRIDLDNLVSIRMMQLSSCSKLKEFNGFKHATKLSTLILQNCPRIESIKGLNDCPQLEALALFDGTKVADGDVSILRRLKKTWLKEFKHYNVKESDLSTITSELAYL